MGLEVRTSVYDDDDYQHFGAALRGETARLMSWFKQDRFKECARPKIGLEIEAWLVGADGNPVAKNAELLQNLNHKLVVPELSRYNIEFNTEPTFLEKSCFSKMAHDLSNLFALAREEAKREGLSIVTIGSLPTLKADMLNMMAMSDSNRYRAMNRGIMEMRRGKPMVLDIEGRDHLKVTHPDIMLEAAATSLQAHLQVPQDDAVRAFNDSMVLAAVSMGVSANSPYVFGFDLWDESRIPIFERGVRVPSFKLYDGQYEHRVTFGHGYLRKCIRECFIENLDLYPVLLPEVVTQDLETLPHLRMHNGNIWRWNRPILGINDDGTPHLRLEHRPIASGPTIVDMVANLAFYFGLVQGYKSKPISRDIPFEFAKQNFYEAARYGLGAKLVWRNDQEIDIPKLVSEELLGVAREGLSNLGVCPEDIKYFLDDIIAERVASKQTGATWQRAYHEKVGDFGQLVERYAELSEDGAPVHTWEI